MIAIVINVVITVNSKETDAVLLEYSEDGSNWIKEYYTYNLKDNKFSWI